MADAVISLLLDQLLSLTREQVEKKVRLVMGVEDEIDNLLRNLEAIRVVVMDAERRRLNDDDSAVKLWLEELKDVSYDMDSVLDEWSTAICKSEIENGVETTRKKVCFSLLFPCCRFDRESQRNQVCYRLDIAQRVQNLDGRINRIAIRKDRFNFKITTSTDYEPKRPNSTSFLDVPVVHGQDNYKKIIIDRLVLSESNQDLNKELQIISIVGMGGIGKTTLAKLVYNDDKVVAHFGNQRLWVCVSDPFDILNIAKEIIEQLTGQTPNVAGSESLMQRFHQSIRGKKFLLVVDDVWTSDYLKWAPLEQALRSGSVGSKVLVTTRKEEVAKMIGDTQMICVKKLSEEECWLLLSEIAFFGKTENEREDIEPIGRKIAQKCNGLPLAAKTLGSLLRVKGIKEWHHVLESDIWDLENVKENLFYPLLLSYNDLPSVEKCCFLYCAIFPKDYKIDREDLIQQWVAQGYFKLKNNEEAEITGQKCFNNLAMRSFFQDFEYDKLNGSIKTCKIHDIVHDFVQFLTLNEYSIISVVNEEKSMDLNARHLTLMNIPSEVKFPISNKKGLRTLVVLCGSPTTCIQSLNLTSLRTLRLSGFKMELPENIGELGHLRYLSLSDPKLMKLPPTIGNLFNLQTLRLLGCRIEALPEEVGKLINLRHLYADYQGLCWPKVISRLSNLQTLKRIFISRNNEKFQLPDLGNLNNLCDVCIEGLGTDEKHVEEAKKAQLGNKKNLVNLVLSFEDDADTENQLNVLEAIRPHENLKYLVISDFFGCFISTSWIISLPNLEKIVLTRCNSCEILPAFGKLPSLVSLCISRLNSLKKMGPEFLGIESDNNSDRGNGETVWENQPNHGSVTLFPKLKELVVERVESLCEWVGIAGWKQNTTLKIMPHLEYLLLRECPSLEALPDFLEATPLKKLVILDSPALERSCERETGKDWPKISHIPNIQIV